MVAFKHEKEGQANQSENAIFLPLQVDRINICRVLNRFQPDPKKVRACGAWLLLNRGPGNPPSTVEKI